MRNLMMLSLVAVFTSACGYNAAVSQETAIKSQWEINMGIRDTMVKEITDGLTIADKERDSLGNTLEKMFVAQNPEDGRGQLMQWSQNAGVDISPELYAHVLDIMEGKREEFFRGQRNLRDKQRVYEESLNSFPGLLVYPVYGFPTKLSGCEGFEKTDPYCPAIDKHRDGVPTVLDFPFIVGGDSKQVAASGQDDWTIGGQQ